MMKLRIKYVPQLVALTLGTALSAPALGVTFSVNTTNDTVDRLIGDGICADASGLCSLRAAIQETNALTNPSFDVYDVVLIPSGTYTLQIPGGSEDAAATGDLDVTDGLMIQGSGAQSTVIDAHSLDRVFHVLHNVYFDLSRVSLTNGLTGNEGGAVAIELGWGSLDEVEITNSRAARGGGVAVIAGGGRVDLDKVSIHGNTASVEGGGVFNRNEMYLLNTTVADNSSTGYGGGVANYGSLQTLNATIGRNTAGNLGGGLANFESGRANVVNTIIAENNGYDCFNPGTMAGSYNLESGTTCNFTGVGSLQSGNADFANLGLFGGQTRSMAILMDSDALNAANEELCPPNDQRGFARTACDIGAYEAPLPVDLSVSVNANPSTVKKGEEVIFEVSVANGRNLAMDPVLNLQLDSHLGIVSASSSVGGCSSAGQTVYCQFGSMYEGEGAHVQVVATALGSGSGPSIATITPQLEDDVDDSNNSDSVVVTVSGGGGGGGAVSPLMLLAGLPLLVLRRRRRS